MKRLIILLIRSVCFCFSAHIMQIFQRRGLLISEDMVMGYLRKYIQTLWGRGCKDPNRYLKPKRKFKSENDDK